MNRRRVTFGEAMTLARRFVWDREQRDRTSRANDYPTDVVTAAFYGLSWWIVSVPESEYRRQELQAIDGDVRRELGLPDPSSDPDARGDVP